MCQRWQKSQPESDLLPSRYLPRCFVHAINILKGSKNKAQTRLNQQMAKRKSISDYRKMISTVGNDTSAEEENRIVLLANLRSFRIALFQSVYVFVRSRQRITQHSLSSSQDKTRAVWVRQREALNAEQEF